MPDGSLNPDDVEAALRPETRLVAIVHGSNVLGTILPIGEVGRICRGQGVPFLVDAAQTAGAYPIDMEAMEIDLLAFAGHKGVYGSHGTGGLVVRPGVGLLAGVRFVLEQGVERIRAHEMEMTGLLMEELRAIPGLTILGPDDLTRRTAVVSVTVEGYMAEQLATVLDQVFDVATRAGLHCAPQAHRTAGTLDCGALRFSPGYFNIAEDVRYAVESLREIV